MNNQTPNKWKGPAIGRIQDVMAHIPWYACRGGSVRLAIDAGISKATVSYLLSSRRNPSFGLMSRVAKTLEQRLGRPMDPRDLIAPGGAFPTRFVCDVVGCTGCLPDAAYDIGGNRVPAFDGVVPGQWVTSRYPKGYDGKGGVHA